MSTRPGLVADLVLVGADLDPVMTIVKIPSILCALGLSASLRETFN